MAHGKDAARDLRYGRRGGRWATDQTGGDVVAEMAELREKGIAEGTWPGHEAEPDAEPTLFEDGAE